MLSMLGTLGEYMSDISIISSIINNVSLLGCRSSSRSYASSLENPVRAPIARALTHLYSFILLITSTSSDAYN